MTPTWNVYAIGYDAALDLAERLNLDSATHFEPSSQVIFGFANLIDALWFRFRNHGPPARRVVTLTSVGCIEAKSTAR